MSSKERNRKLNYQILNKTSMQTTIEFKRINNDVNGNPRHVFHYLNIHTDYETAVKMAKKIGGKKFHNKQYGGGIVVQSYNLQETERYIKSLTEEV